MGSPSHYWQLVTLNPLGQRRVEVVAIAKDFFEQQFPDVAQQTDAPDAIVQRQCWTLMQRQAGDRSAQCAELCLRCFISHHIEGMCQRLAAQFGRQHGFTTSDLLPYVLDDVGRRQQSSSYRSLATRILESYDPSKAGLSTWVHRLARQHEELERFLLEQGVYLLSDWAILNDTQPGQLDRILGGFHQLSIAEIAQATQLLQAYHAVYRQARIQQRLSGSSGRCQPPTPEQLSQIAVALDPPRSRSPEVILSQLQALATQLRQYRIAVRRGGSLQTASIADPAVQVVVDQIQAPDREDDDQTNLLQRYRSLFLKCLDEAIAQVTQDRLTTLPRKRTPAQLLTALHLLHCQGRSMTEIAPHVNLGGQSQVSRLLQLPDFRADIRQRWLVALRDRVPALVQDFDRFDRLQDWDQRLDRVLNEEVEAVIQETTAETSAARQRPLTSLFARRLCQYLDVELGAGEGGGGRVKDKG